MCIQYTSSGQGNPVFRNVGEKSETETCDPVSLLSLFSKIL